MMGLMAVAMVGLLIGQLAVSNSERKYPGGPAYCSGQERIG